ncbi:baseplate J/gp47 family protein [Clostridium sp. HBUAS56010]|uniref:baseplate J/gp47 family protein n=1 Tax=Clostridium sp. HBUAS56010 TaxID=2571127 RepID=UPI001177EEEC|nr:baseplate J/gp47 family protein [Clostridium sp. HBUAS56010]
MIDFSNKTYANILAAQLNRVPDTIDKREGAMVQTALGPESWYLEGLYLDLDSVQKNAYAETAGGAWLDMLVAERGLERKTATKAVKKGIFNIQVPIGSRFSALTGSGYLTYKVIEFKEQTEAGYEYKMECETVGEIGNNYSGQLVAVDYVTGLISAQLTELLSGGTEEETDASLRERYFATFDVPTFGGNIASYRNAILAINGVGAVQIYPAWQGGGTVLCSILDGNYKPAGSTLIEEVQNTICPPEDDEAEPSPNGYGLAPIGAAVTIGTGEELQLDISLTVQFISGIQNGETAYKSQIEEKIEEYLESVRQSWGAMLKSQKIEYSVTVYVSRIIYAILTIPEIVNVTDVTLNGSASDVVCVETSAVQQVPIMGTVIINGG